MKNKPEEIPPFIYDWMEVKNFNSLQETQKEEVLKYFSEEEYETMHLVVVGIKMNANAHKSNREEVKKELLNLFDTKYSERKNLLVVPGWAWKSVAVLFMFTTGWITHYLMQHDNRSSLTVNGSTDTVYIAKEMATVPEKIFDTVYIEKDITKPSDTRYTSKVKVGNQQKYSPSKDLYINTNILSLKEADSKANKQKGNSMKEDSLLRKYPFVTL